MARGRRAGILLILGSLALLAAAALAPPAEAQQEEACRRPVLEVAEGPREWEPGTTFAILVAIVNVNEPPVQSVTARLDVSAPQGWAASLAQTQFALAPLQENINPLTITAPQRGTGYASGDVVVTAHFTCHRGGLDARSQSYVTIPVELRPVRLPWLLVGAGLVVALASVSVVWGVRSRLPRVFVKSPQPERDVVPGKGAQFPLVVGNRRREPDGVVLTVGDVPTGWSAHVAVDEVELEPREERSLWLMVRAPPDAPRGAEARLTVRASSRKYPREAGYVEVTARVALPP